jgi:hypothetical protein
MVGDLSQNTLYNVSGFSLPPSNKTVRHIITEKLLSMAKKQNIVMKYMIGSGFSTDIYECVWFSKILNK